MRSYNRNSRSGDNRRPGGHLARGGGGDFRRSSGRREMHKAVCDECGKSCEVPFRPSGEKPIYCSDCFEKRNGGSTNRPSRRGYGGSGFEKRDNTNKQLLNEVGSLNEKLDRILKVIEGSAEKKVVKKITSKDKIENPEHSRRKLKTKKASKKKLKKSA